MKEVNQIIEQLKKKKYKPVYFLSGDEAFFIDKISNYIEKNILPEEAKSFDQMLLYGMDVNVQELVLQARRFPMIGDKQVIIIKEAQHLFRKKAETDAFESYLNNPAENTILVFNYKYKKIDKRKKIFKLIQEKGVYFEAKRLYENETLNWIVSTAKEMSYEIDLKSAQMLLDFLGTDLSKIYNELDKLSLLLPKNSRITPETIEINIGISKEFNNFELKSAIALGNYHKAQNIINYFSSNPKEHAIASILPLLYNFFRDLFIYHSLNDQSKFSVARALKINPYFYQEYQRAAIIYPMKKVTKNIGYLRKADMQSKGVDAGNMTHKDILNELIFKLMH